MVNISERREVEEFALFPKEVEGKTIWLKSYISVQEKSVVEHEECHDCYNPMSLCDKTPRVYWNTVKTKLK